VSLFQGHDTIYLDVIESSWARQARQLKKASASNCGELKKILPTCRTTAMRGCSIAFEAALIEKETSVGAPHYEADSCLFNEKGSVERLSPVS
jgi:hypothetical protein